MFRKKKTRWKGRNVFSGKKTSRESENWVRFDKKNLKFKKRGKHKFSNTLKKGKRKKAEINWIVRL